MKAAALALAVFAATGCLARNSSSGGSKPSSTSLEISLSIRGSDSPTRVWTLRCPAGGTLPRPTPACKRLDGIDHPFAPVPKGVACTQIYGGPQVAEVRGTFHGQPVNARFTRADGCEISRWNRVGFLFPVQT